ncbi:hypothetical protein VB638_08875 [Dolichospermum sp. UHCC 0684]|jgi:hypothetical protein|uniref:hypothetical protein n=1 Tax=unclassified Dolichospermum TaxID=2622029 RepID=UPI0014457CF7|nr:MULTISPECIES: hypothetical protein [unclassified Dolichospermum]MEA5529703.1 hypothetical protein [Dolichospermum sp. UHCC 0684]MTJ34730.1 hypothetical protein [Dolichospermum sp. UHCC 0260]
MTLADTPTITQSSITLEENKKLLSEIGIQIVNLKSLTIQKRAYYKNIVQGFYGTMALLKMLFQQKQRLFLK